MLIFGLDGCGKTRAWAELRSMYEKTGTPGHFHVLGMEPGRRAQVMAQAYLDGTPGNNFFSNATIYDVKDWDSLLVAGAKIEENATEADWLVVDSVGFAWEWAQDSYIEKAFGKTKQEFFANNGKAKDLNYQIINANYRAWLNGYALDFPGHRLFVARAEANKAAERPGDWATAPELIQLFGRHGHHPIGQKHTAYSTPTRLRLEEIGVLEFAFTTLKDTPGRDYATKQPLVSFPLSYMMGYAHWQVTE